MRSSRARTKRNVHDVEYIHDSSVFLTENIMKETKYLTKVSALKRAQEAIGIPFKDIDKTGRLDVGKGAIGTVIEESWFGYAPNSDSEPDLPEAGIEIKVTPYIRGKNGIKAKERLVCNIINYMEEYDKIFSTSAFWKKCNTMLLMSYEHLADKPKGELHIDAAVLFGFPEEDLAIIEHDWQLIMEKVRSGRAHEISEGDTMYLAACTKGANSSSMRSQPFSDILAKQRAYSLKLSYMTQILNRYIFGTEQCEKIVKDPSILRDTGLEEHIIAQVSPYIGKTQAELKDIFGVHTSAKSINEILLARMLGIHGKIAYTEEFQKAGIVPKTIRVRKNGTIKESMSFPTFDPIRLSLEDEWEESEIYNYLAPTKFLFVIFQEDEQGISVFKRLKFWNIQNKDLEEVRVVWERTIQTIRKGVRLVVTERGVKNDLPKQTENRVAHVRPHGRNGNDRSLLPDGRMIAKQCFWLNNTYIAEQIE